jgi:TetR/AcrR family transcriptional repressor of nem operon
VCSSDLARFWNVTTEKVFAAAPYNGYSDPLDRLIGYIDFRARMIRDQDLAERTCLIGTMVQETYRTHPSLRVACDDSIMFHATMVMDLIEEAKARHAPHASWSAEGLALHTQSVIQGAFIVAKAKNQPNAAADSILHLRRYVELLFHYGKDD